MLTLLNLKNLVSSMFILGTIQGQLAPWQMKWYGQKVINNKAIPYYGSLGAELYGSFRILQKDLIFSKIH